MVKSSSSFPKNSNGAVHKSSPAFQDKEERRLITLASMDNLLKFHEIERQEKYNALKFYSAFIGGGIALLVGISKVSIGIDALIYKYLSITIIVTINLLVAKKLIAVRGATNNIYHEYGRRLRFLLNSHSSDLDDDGLAKLRYAFQKYIDAQKQGPLLPKHSADTFEVKGLIFITVLFSLSFWLPVNEFIVSVLSGPVCASIALTFIHVFTVFYFALSIVGGASRMPNISSNEPLPTAET
jgi:hypothetical protein